MAQSQDSYHFGVSAEFIWASHILMGLFFVYIGYEIITHKKIPTYLALIIVVLGALGGLYHAHIWINSLMKSHVRSKGSISV
jgi:hypothetical protein